MATQMLEAYEHNYYEEDDIKSRMSAMESRSTSDTETSQYQVNFEREESDNESLLNASIISMDQDKKEVFQQNVQEIIERREKNRLKRQRKKEKNIEEKNKKIVQAAKQKIASKKEKELKIKEKLEDIIAKTRNGRKTQVKPNPVQPEKKEEKKTKRRRNRGGRKKKQKIVEIGFGSAIEAKVSPSKNIKKRADEKEKDKSEFVPKDPQAKKRRDENRRKRNQRKKKNTNRRKVNNNLKKFEEELVIKSSMTPEEIKSRLYIRYGDLLNEYVIHEYLAGVDHINKEALNYQGITWEHDIQEKKNWLKKLNYSKTKIENEVSGCEIGRWENTQELIFKGKEPFELNISLPGEEGENDIFDSDVKVIEYSSDGTVVFMLPQPFIQKDNLLLNCCWTVKESLFLVELALTNQTRNLEVFKNVDSKIKNALIGKKYLNINKRFFKQDNGLGYQKVGGKKYLSQLNQSQVDAISSIMSERLSLIQGPPGTGKTTTMATAVMCLYNYLKKYLNDRNGRILVCADSNQAVNNLTEKIMDVFKFHGVSTSKVVRLMSNHAYEKIPFDYQKIGKNTVLSNQIFTGKKRGQLLGCEILCTTLSMASSIEKKIPKGKFLYSIIDEASQSLEASTLSALKTSTQKLILVGDQKQLGPVVLSQAARNDEYKSIFERLIEEGNEFSRLKIQYRMHPTIANNSNDMFYDGEIENGVSKKQRNEWTKCPKVFKNGPKSFMRIVGTESKACKSYVNYGEVEKIVEVLKEFRSSNIKPEDIGVIAMYSAQVSKIKRAIRYKLGGYFLNKLKVATVDSFQGSEMKFIVISAVRSNNRGGIGFLKDGRRLNVAITRAKHGLVIVGNPDTLKSDENWSHIVKDYTKSGFFY